MSPSPYLLVAEDDPDDLLLIRRAVAHLCPGLRVDEVRDGEALMRVLSGLAPESMPVVVLLDLNMPRVGGREFLRQLQGRDDFLGCPFVAFTTSSDAREREQILALGVDDFQTKPDQFSELVACMRGLLQRWAPGVLDEVEA